MDRLDLHFSLASGSIPAFWAEDRSSSNNSSHSRDLTPLGHQARCRSQTRNRNGMLPKNY